MNPRQTTDVSKRTSRIQVVSKLVLVLLWLVTLVVALAWALNSRLPYGLEAEPVTVVFGLVSAAVTALIGYFGVELRAREKMLVEEQYSMPMGLAYGYVHNFVEPLMRKLIREAGERSDRVRLHVFIPDDLGDLRSAAVETILARIRAKQYTTKVVQLELETDRPRDVLTVMRGDSNNLVFFDFPNTLLTLEPVVRFKTKSDRNGAESERQLGRKFIQRFKECVEQEVADVKLGDYVKLTDSRLSFLDSPAAG